MNEKSAEESPWRFSVAPMLEWTDKLEKYQPNAGKNAR
jgi:hypothetical protein